MSWRFYFQSLFALIKKEWITLFYDPAARRILIAPIIVQAILFGYGATFNLDKVPFVYFDADNSSYSRTLIEKLRASQIFSVVRTTKSEYEVNEAVTSGIALIGIFIPEDLSKKIVNKREASVNVIVDARNSTTASVAIGYIGATLEDTNQAFGAFSPITLKDRYLFNENNITRWSILPAMTIGLSMLQVMLLAGLTVSREREEGSFDMMLLTPLTPTQIFIGKATAPLIVGVIQAGLIYLICRYWFDIPLRGSSLDIFLVVTFFSLSLVGLGMAVSAYATTIQQSMILTFFIVLPSLVLSGIMTPISAMPEIMQTLTMANPARFAIEMVKRIYLEGESIFDLLYLFIPMFVILVVTIPGAIWLFRNKIS